jgi:hypothetical protein
MGPHDPLPPQKSKEPTMTNATTPAAVAASKSSLDTMLDTIEQGTEALQSVLPEVAVLGGFVPGATVYIQLAGLALPVVQNAIKWIEQEENKSPIEAFKDLMRTLAPNNGFIAPSLAKAAGD